MLTQFEYDVLYLRCQTCSDTETPEHLDARQVAENLKTSINAVARAVRSLRAGGYLDMQQHPTAAGLKMRKEPIIYASKFNTYRSRYLS